MDKLTREQRLEIANKCLKNTNQKLRQENKKLKEQVLELELKLEDKELQRKLLLEKMYKPNKNKDGILAKPLGKKPGAKGYQRPKPKESEITEETKFIPTRCPYCRRRDTLSPAKETIVKYQEDIVIIPEKIVKKYIVTKHWCSNCQEYVRSDKVPLNIERIGPNVMAYVLYARYRLRLPYNKIQQSLKDLHNFKISEGEIAAQLEKAKEFFKSDFQAICELIKISDKVYCDETGWRVKGNNFWIWVFVTDKGTKYAIEDTRGKGIAENNLGDNENRVLISDFYAAYKNLPGKNQYCWVHLLRDSKLTESQFHQDLKGIYQELTYELTKEPKQRNKKRLDKLLEEIAKKPYHQDNTNDIQKQKVQNLQRRIQKYKDQLLTCLDYKDVLPDNNTAERALRNAVVMRKIFGGSRSYQGAKVMETNLSVIETLLKQNPNKNFFQVILPKLNRLRNKKRP